MSKFDPTRDPPFFAVLRRTPPEGADAGQFIDAGERLIGLAAAEPGFMGIEDVVDDDGTEYTVCYWTRATSLRRWKEDLHNHVPPKIDTAKVVCFDGCLWHWLEDVFDAASRAERDNVVVASFGDVAA